MRVQSFLFTIITMFFCVYSVQMSAQNKLKCAGCKTAAILMKELANECSHTSFNPGKTGNKKALQLLASGKIDFAFTCKPLTKLIVKFGLKPEQTSNWSSLPFAKDPIVVVVNPDSGISDLTLVQLTKIFIGDVTNWKDLGGTDLPIRVAIMDMNKVETGNNTVFKECTLQKYVDPETNKVVSEPNASPNKQSTILPQAKLLDSPDKLGNYCKSTSGAVVFMGLNSYKQKYGTCISVGGTKATINSVVSGSYPMAVTYYLITKNTPQGMKLKEFISSEEGKKVINRNFVAIK